jgi:transcriptional regulator with XRE-family HTH domain
MPSFGSVIATARKARFLSQRELAARLKKEDGEPISAQYLNDIERDRRNAPPEYLIAQLARELKLDRDRLCLLAGCLPKDLMRPISESEPEFLMAAFREFRRKLQLK